MRNYSANSPKSPEKKYVKSFNKGLAGRSPVNFRPPCPRPPGQKFPPGLGRLYFSEPSPSNFPGRSLAFGPVRGADQPRVRHEPQRLTPRARPSTGEKKTRPGGRSSAVICNYRAPSARPFREAPMTSLLLRATKVFRGDVARRLIVIGGVAADDRLGAVWRSAKV